jgi:TRAP-type C4-dicarboxylate transport system substrate-binding protein
MGHGLFPLTEISAFPWVLPTAEYSTKALNAVYQKGYLDKELADVKVLYMFSPVADSLFTTKKQVKSLADIKGLKIGVSGGVADTVAGMGGVPVMMGPPDLYMNLDKGIIDGCFNSWVSGMQLKWLEPVNYAVVPGFCGSVSLATMMNKDVWNKLPKGIQAIMDDLGPKYVDEHVKHDIKETDAAKKYFLGRSGQITTFDAATLAAADPVFVPIWNKIISDREAKGLPIRDVLDTYWNSLKQAGVEKPAIGYTPKAAAK